MIQLAVNNVAAVLSNVAAFQAGRSARIWKGEVNGLRSGDARGKESVRLAAAAVMTPVAPGDYRVDLNGGSAIFRKTRAGFLATQLPIFNYDGGVFADQIAIPMQAMNPNDLLNGDLVVARSFDRSSFPLRAVRKFTMAYHSTSVNVTESDEKVFATLYYNHHIAMPLVGPIFGAVGVVGGRRGYYRTIRTEVEFKPQHDANASFPTP